MRQSPRNPIQLGNCRSCVRRAHGHRLVLGMYRRIPSGPLAMTGAIGPETGAGHTRTHTAVEPVACRGLSSDGQLVDGNAADSPTPVAVLG